MGTHDEDLAKAAAELEALREQRIAQALRRMRNAAISGAWDAWAEATALTRKMKKIVRRVINSKMSGAFDRWAEMTAEAKEMRVLLERCAKKILHRQVSSGLEF